MSTWTTRAVLRSRVTLWLLACLTLSLISLWLLRPILNQVHQNTGHDFILLYAASQALRAHQNPYDLNVFLNQASAAGIPRNFLIYHGQMNQPYVYPPLFAWLITPLTYFAPLRALLIWRVFSLACIFVGTLGLEAAWTATPGGWVFASRFNRIILAALVTTSPMALYGVYWGNPVVVAYAAMGGWVWALSRNRPRTDILAGILMTGALLKPQLTVPLAVLAALCLIQGTDARSRRTRVALSFAAAAVALLVLDVVLTGPDLLVAWPQSVLYLSGQIYTQPDMPSLIGTLRPILLHESGRVQRIVLYGALLMGAGCASWLYIRLRRTWTPAALLGLLTLIWCFAAPYAHANDDLLLVPAGLALVAVLPLAVDQLLDAAPSSGRAERLFVAAQVITSPLALVLLWRGGVLGFDLSAPLNPAIPTIIFTLAPVAALVALGIAGRLFADVVPTNGLQAGGNDKFSDGAFAGEARVREGGLTRS